jgi:hypothetical protein
MNSGLRHRVESGRQKMGRFAASVPEKKLAPGSAGGLGQCCAGADKNPLAEPGAKGH